MPLRAALLLALAFPAGGLAQQPAGSAHAIAVPLQARATELLGVLAGRPYDRFFTPAFFNEVPPSRLDPLIARLRDTLGEPVAVAAIGARSPSLAEITVRYQRGTALVRLAIEPGDPFRVTGLLVTGTTLAHDTWGAIDAAVTALPGEANLGVYALGEGTPRAVAEHRGAASMPIASVFKLWVLAEAARQVAAGMHRWDEVVPLGAASLPSGLLQRWPVGSPLTLATLATLMISVSDNTATDTLMAVLGRERIDALAAASGMSVPVLSTREVFAIKADAALAKAWAGASQSGRQAMLLRERPRIASASLDPDLFTGGALPPDVEWYASPQAVAAMLDRLRRDPMVLAMLAVNPGTNPAVARRLSYVGFKGGSEPGIASYAFLARTPDGRWYAVVAGWHRRDGAVDEARLLDVAGRALVLVSSPRSP